MPPSRRTSASSIGEFESTIRLPAGTEPGASNSSPDTMIRTRGRRYTSTGSWPIDASSPTSCGSNRRPAPSTTLPAAMSSPTRPTFLPAATGAITSTRSPVSRASSARNTASAPSGTGAPVMMRMAAPDVSGSADRSDPGIEAPRTASGTGL